MACKVVVVKGFINHRTKEECLTHATSVAVSDECVLVLRQVVYGLLILFVEFHEETFFRNRGYCVEIHHI